MDFLDFREERDEYWSNWRSRYSNRISPILFMHEVFSVCIKIADLGDGAPPVFEPHSILLPETPDDPWPDETISDVQFFLYKLSSIFSWANEVVDFLKRTYAANFEKNWFVSFCSDSKSKK